MFPNLFHIALSEGLISLSIRSAETRSDEYFFTREDIEPALNDDPADNEWSGSEVFQMKRKARRGSIRIRTENHWVYWTVSRQEIEILNAQLKGVCEDAPYGLLRPSTVVIHSDFKQQSQPQIPQFSSEELLREIRVILQEELRKCLLAQVAPTVLSREPINQSTNQPPPQRPQDTFIPSNLSTNLEGTVSAQEQEHKSISALEAAKKLKEFKK